MSRQVAVVVGATSGIGKATALRLSRNGTRILAIGRSPERSIRLMKKLALDDDVAAIDMSTQQGWAGAAEWVRARTDHIDVLINAAGVMHPTRQTTPEGFELNFTVHHLAPFALTSRLLPLLRLGGVVDGPAGRTLPRVVNVNSAGHQMSMAGHANPVLDFEDLQSGRDYNPFLAYSRSKLANLLFTFELARRYGDELAVVAVHPGVVRTDIGRNFPRLQVAVAQVLAISPETAARDVVGLATGTLAANGRYYDRARPALSSPPSRDPVAALRLWAATEEMCGEFAIPNQA